MRAIGLLTGQENCGKRISYMKSNFSFDMKA
jgi:hypothetical protein